jgi:uncharacterized protein (DUF433 family)
MNAQLRISAAKRVWVCPHALSVSVQGSTRGAPPYAGPRKPIQCYSDHVQQFSRISTNPEVMGGKPCIRGMRVTVGMIVEALAAGRTVENLLSDFPYLQDQDIREALAYAASLAQGREFPLAS